MTPRQVFHRRDTNVTTYTFAIYTTSDQLQVCMPRSHYSPKAIYISLLLLLGGAESNPRPANTPAIRIGSLNARSAAHKGAIIDDLIRDKRLDVLAVCESWNRNGAHDVIKNDLAPSDISVLHFYRPRAAGSCRSRKGGSHALLYNNNLSARLIYTKFSPTSFDLQLVGLQVKSWSPTYIVRRQVPCRRS